MESALIGVGWRVTPPHPLRLSRHFAFKGLKMHQDLYTDDRYQSLSVHQFRLMGYYLDRNRRWPMTMKTIAKTCKMAVSTCNEAIRDLADMGLVELPHVLQRRNEPGYIYIVCDEQHRYKIGVAISFATRLGSLQSGNADLLSPVFVSGEINDPYKIERQLQKHFKDIRIRGEWYHLLPMDIEYIKGLVS